MSQMAVAQESSTGKQVEPMDTWAEGGGGG
jgi:hypothetical protein